MLPSLSSKVSSRPGCSNEYLIVLSVAYDPDVPLLMGLAKSPDRGRGLPAVVRELAYVLLITDEEAAGLLI